MGKHCNKMISCSACLGMIFAFLGGISYLILRGMREAILLDLDEYSEIKTEWETRPFTELTMVPQEQYCPSKFPTLVAWDNWPGLDVMCFCNSDSRYPSTIGTKCEGDRAATTRCSTREALPTLYLGVLDGYKICGRRGAQQFSEAVRPQEGADGNIKCPSGTVPCDPDAFKTPVFKDGLLEDVNHKAHSVTCVESVEFCPITFALLRYNKDVDPYPILKYSKLAGNLPILKMKVSADQPCLRPSYYNAEKSLFFKDEIRKQMSPCPKSEYFDTLTDPRWIQIPGDYAVS